MNKKTFTREIFEQEIGLRDLYKLLSRKEIYSNFIDRDIIVQYKCLENEIKELKEGIQKRDAEETVKELADVVYLLGLIVSKLLEQNIITSDQISGIFTNHSNKIYKRSPQLLYGKKETHEKEEQLRYDGKDKKQLELFTSLHDTNESKTS